MTLNLLVDDDQNFLDFMGFSGKSEKDRITVPLGNRGSSTGDMKQFFFLFLECLYGDMYPDCQPNHCDYLAKECCDTCKQ